MRILFGPENDFRHIPDPAPSGAYEWWYFDAFSDDGRYALVAIFLLGSPMTPYYKFVAEGNQPDPMDWCGVFFTLHENVNGKWKERAYAYNLYRDGDFHTDKPEVSVGGSRLTYDAPGKWRVSIHERGLWRGRIEAEMTFEMPLLGDNLSPEGDSMREATHAWVCTAPVCALNARIQINHSSPISFRGAGYHDHNFGTLPLRDVAAWYWARGQVDSGDGLPRSVILYYVSEISQPVPRVTALLFDAQGGCIACNANAIGSKESPVTNAYGLTHPVTVTAASVYPSPGVTVTATFLPEAGPFSEGPFYRRLPVKLEAAWGGSDTGAAAWTGTGTGIGEVFVPSRLCGPIASRAMWSRIRRRNRL
ncbi:MAG: hypothetical protein H7Z41_09460 [Cytophagales bacterium]|nr:hypothetical protein [Armatimonadota bacterium]